MARRDAPARDLELIDALDACERETLAENSWRVVPDGRDPLQGGPSRSRWCDGTFDILYTSLERDGAIAEVDAFLRLQPVIPSKRTFSLFSLRARTARTLRIADMRMLAGLGVDIARYKERDYARTSAIAETAHFLDYDGLIAPSARHDCFNFMLFTGRVAPDAIDLVAGEPQQINFTEWRKSRA